MPTLAGGALFGLVSGTVLTVMGAVTGAIVASLIGRHLGRAQLQEPLSRRGARFEQWLDTRGFLALLCARLVPIIPFNLLNYTAGVAGIPTRSYVIATAVGIVPGTIACTALGSAAARPGSASLIVSMVAVLLLTLVVGALSRRSRRAVSAQ